MTTAVITMAGFGRRFLDAGYRLPKYQIEAHGRSLFEWSMSSLASFIRAGTDFVFVVRREDQASSFISDSAGRVGIEKFAIIQLDAPTDGQATTALLAAPAIPDLSAPLLIYNIDTFVDPKSLPANEPRGDGWIPCFPADGDHWSFARTGADGRALELREKIRISPHATIGLYWFSSFKLYESSYSSFYEAAGTVEMNERYVAPLYNHLIMSGNPVYVHQVPKSDVYPLGVPADVERFVTGNAPHVS
jgi:NDP-sugar pyrophosphorylase family protein